MAKFEFKSMTHMGPVFPPLFQSSNLTFKGDKLSALAEEMLYCYARYFCGMTDMVNKNEAQRKQLAAYVNNKYFNSNFYNCLKYELTTNQKAADFPNDFKQLLDGMYAKQLADKASKSAKTDDEKEAEAKFKELYGFATVDGKQLPRGSYVIEAPSIIITRGESKLIGSWKYRVNPEDVVINWVDPTGTVPEPVAPAGHNWGKVENNLNSVNTFYYRVNVGRDKKGLPITVKEKWCRLGGEVNQNADQIKYDKALQLVKDMLVVDKAVQDTLTKKLPNKPSAADIKERDCALILYIVRQTGIRIGGDHEEWEAPTEGASTLLKKSMKILPNGQMKLDFDGKDSVAYHGIIDMDPSVSSLLAKILYTKADNEQIFSCSADDVNKYLQNIVPYATIKLYRTSIATSLACKELQAAEITKGMSVARKLQIFENVNLAVAKKLNHQKNISANFKEQADKLAGKLKEAKAKKAETEAKAKEDLLKLQKEIDAAKTLYSGAKLKEKLTKLKEKSDKIKERVKKAEERVEAAKIRQQQKTATANYALGTSKSAYFGPQVIYSWCHTFDVPVEKIYSKTLREKYSWAESVDNDYWKNYPVL